MVQIERSEEETREQTPLGGQVAVGQSSIDSEAITEESIPVDSSAMDHPDDPNAPAFAGAESVADPHESDSPTSALSWQSEKAQRSRQIALVVAVSISGLLLAIAIFGWFIQSWRAPVVTPVAPITSSTPESDTPKSDTPKSDTPKSDTGLANDATPLAESADPMPPSEVASDASADTNVNTAVEPRVPTVTDSSPSMPTDLMPQSPILVPSESAAQAKTASSPDPGVAEKSDMQELPAGFAKFTDFLLKDGHLNAPNLAAPPTMDEVKIDGAAEDDVDPLATKPKPLNLRADLGIEMALSSDGYPLPDLMLVISQMTDVPIQLDWVSFDLAGIPIDSLAKPPKGWQSARNILDHVANQFGAVIREQELLIAMTLSDEKFDAKMAEIADLSDFGNRKDSASLVLAQFLMGTEFTKLVVGDSREDKQLAALAIESLRRMRVLEPKVANERFRHWALAKENDTLDWPLVTGGQAAPTSGTPMTLAGFLCRTARQNQTTCVVNWHDLNRRNVAPQSLLLPHPGGDAATTLELSLERFSIQVRQVDPQHWWVGSEHTYDQLPVVVWTSPLGEFRKAFELRLSTVMAAHPGKPFRMTFDDESGRALLLLPRYIVRQLAKLTESLVKS